MENLTTANVHHCTIHGPLLGEVGDRHIPPVTDGLERVPKIGKVYLLSLLRGALTLPASSRLALLTLLLM